MRTNVEPFVFWLVARQICNLEVMDIQISADQAVLWLRAHQLCCLGGRAGESGEIIFYSKKLKDGPSADLADYLNADEEERKTDNAPLVEAKENEVAAVTATIETNLWGHLGVAADSVKDDLAETENSVAGDEASSEWEERQKSRVESPQLM